MKRNSGFTLIELLIVIGLLGALTALVLPSLSADREEALGDVCDYNNAGTLRTLRQFGNMYGVYPTGFHTGLNAEDGTTAVDGEVYVAGLPDAQSINMLTGTGATAPGYVVQLDANQKASLDAAGITTLAYGEDLPIGTTAATSSVVQVLSSWTDDGGAAFTFDGIPANVAPAAGTKSWIDEDADGTAEGIVIRLWITPTMDWDVQNENANLDWSKGNMELAIDMPGACPIPAEALSGTDGVSFSYYMAYFKVYNDGTKADLIGTSCPEDGIFNP